LSGDAYIPNVELLFVVFAVCGSAAALVLNFIAPQLNMKVPTPFPEDADSAPADSAEVSPQHLGKSSYAVLQDDI